MASEHNRGTGHARMKWYMRVPVDTKKSAPRSDKLPPDFDPAVPRERPLDAASPGDGIVNLWFTVPLFDGFSEECRLVLPLERGRFRL